jgi:hypothetical protein
MFLDEFPPNYDRYMSKALSLQLVAEELIILIRIIRRESSIYVLF